MSEEPVPSAGRYVVPVRVAYDGRGGPTPKQARGPHWRRTTRGFYVPTATPTDDVGQRIVEASVVVPQPGAITGWAALWWLGGVWFDGTARDGSTAPVDLIIGTHDIRPQRGLRISAEAAWPRCILVRDGLRITDAAFSVAFMMRHATSDREAATVLDMACYSDLVSIAEEADCLTPHHNSWTGVPRARRALTWCDENSWSPAESRMRLTWHLDGGHPMPLANRPIFDRSGHHLATPDLIDPDAGVIGEYDGAGHLTRESRDVDLVREELLRTHDLECVVMTAADRDPTAFLGRLHRAYARARSRPADRRTWTLTPPDWWKSTHTVDLRRALTADERARYLRYRRSA